MNYAQMRQYDIANGPGIRATLFVSGCSHHCKGCFNEAYQDFNYGTVWDTEAENQFMSYLMNPNVHGVTLLGGEPMEQGIPLLRLVERIKAETTHDIWVYSGYLYETLLQDVVQSAILKQCDVLVDGPFVEAEKDLNLTFRGSRNQRIIDLKASLKQNEVILWSQKA